MVFTHRAEGARREIRRTMKLIKPMTLPLFLFAIAASILLTVHFWLNWGGYFFTPEDDEFHPEEPAGELVTESELNASLPLLIPPFYQPNVPPPPLRQCED